MQRITQVTINNGSSLHLQFADGTVGTYDLSPLMASGGVFAALRDPNCMAEVRIGGGGRFIEWPNEIDLCSDALWLAIHKSADAA